MKLAQTNLSKLKACRKLAGGKAESRRPRSASHFVTTLKGWQSRQQKDSRTPSGCNDMLPAFRGCRSAQPPANFRQPFRLLQTAQFHLGSTRASRVQADASSDCRAWLKNGAINFSSRHPGPTRGASDSARGGRAPGKMNFPTARAAGVN